MELGRYELRKAIEALEDGKLELAIRRIIDCICELNKVEYTSDSYYGGSSVEITDKKDQDDD